MNKTNEVVQKDLFYFDTTVGILLRTFTLVNFRDQTVHLGQVSIKKCDIFEMSIKHNSKMTAFPMSDVIQPKSDFLLLCEVIPRSVVVDVLMLIALAVITSV